MKLFLRPSVCASLAILVVLLLSVSQSNADLLVNSGFDGPEVSIIGDTNRNPITNDPSGTWILGGNDNSDRWEIVGGSVASNGSSGSEAQGMVQWVQDGQATTGTATLDFDVRMQSGSGDYDLYLYTFGWNAGDAAPNSDYENGSAGTGDSFTPNDSVNLITDTVADGEGRFVLAENGSPVFSEIVNDGIFHSGSVNVDFGTGYDYIGVMFYGENSGGIMEIDNVSFTFAAVPEPSTILLWTLGLLGMAFYGRRWKR